MVWPESRNDLHTPIDLMVNVCKLPSTQGDGIPVSGDDIAFWKADQALANLY